MIIKFENKYEEKLNEFIKKYNNEKEYFVAWVPENIEKIKELDKSNFLLCIEEDNVVGCLGTYISKEQSIVRLLGPIIIKEHFNKHIDELYEKAIEALPIGMKEIRIAFYSDNELCREFFDKKAYEQYNAEKTIVLNKELYKGRYSNKNIEVIPYETKYKEGLSLVHPKGTFFTLEELIDHVNENNYLYLALVEDEVAGYIFYEVAKDNSIGEIALLHVREDKRGSGYGSLLLEKTIDEMLARKISEILTSVRLENYGAQRLYKRIGFEDREIVFAYKLKLQ